MIVASALSTITSTHGVRGVAVFDGEGSCVAYDLPPPYEPILVAEALRRIAAASDVFASLNSGEMSAFSAHCEGGAVIVRRLESHTVLTLTAPGININLLNVALNVFALNLSRAAHSMGRAASSSDLGSLFSGQQSQMLTPSRGETHEQVPPDAVGRAMVLKLLKTFTNYMGPAAKVVMKDELDELGVSSRTLRASQCDDLVSRLASRIPSGERQERFLMAARDALYG